MSNLELMQNKLLEMMKWFHNYCVEHHIPYYMIGGTMLGAVRHKGFIPWDDDIDVGIPRKAYIRLVKEFYDKNGHYVLESPLSKDKKFSYPFAKLYDTRTLLIENTPYKLKRGIYIDVFPLDFISDTQEGCIKEINRITSLHKVVIAKNLTYKKDRVLKNKIAISLIHNFPERIMPINYLCRALDKFGYDHCKYNYSYGGNLYGQWGAKELMHKSIMGKPTLYKFQDSAFYGVEKYDEYLTNLYGNWRELPPEDKRITHHDYYLDMNKSYLDV